MNICEKNGGVEVSDFGTINLEYTLFCGQAFRWVKTGESSFYGITQGHETAITQVDADMLFFVNTSRGDVENIWLGYLDMNRDYAGIIKEISQDPIVDASVKANGVIHILNQEPWECLCSFIISACNNIPRITKIVRTLCENFGEKTGNGYSFPSAAVIASKTEEDLAVLHAGYRVPYILDAAKKVASGEIDLEKLKTVPEDEARKTLMTIFGVGKKVADCTLLYSLGFFNSYPVDRHIARANEEFYPGGLPACFDGAKGLAQQYIFMHQSDNAAGN